MRIGTKITEIYFNEKKSVVKAKAAQLIMCPSYSRWMVANSAEKRLLKGVTRGVKQWSRVRTEGKTLKRNETNK